MLWQSAFVAKSHRSLRFLSSLQIAKLIKDYLIGIRRKSNKISGQLFNFQANELQID